MAVRITLPFAVALAVALSAPATVLAAAPSASHAAHADGRSGADRETTHVVAKGQTLGRIAKRYRVTVDELYELNHLHRGQPIKPGMVLVIHPGAKRRVPAHGRPAPHSAKGSFARRPKRRVHIRMVRGDERCDA